MTFKWVHHSSWYVIQLVKLIEKVIKSIPTLQWRHEESDGVSNHDPHDYLLNRLIRRRSNKTSKLRVTGLCGGNSPATGEFPAQRPVTRKMFQFDDVIMMSGISIHEPSLLQANIRYFAELIAQCDCSNWQHGILNWFASHMYRVRCNRPGCYY